MNRLFFGWYIVAGAVVLVAYQSLMFVYGFTAFMTPISATFGWSMAQVAFASSLRGLETGTLDPFLGMAVDRWPARRLIIIGIILTAAGTIFISRSTSLMMFYGGFLIVGLGGALCSFMVPTTVIARWFKKNIGKANGVLAMGFAIGGLFVAALTKAIDTYGWQDTLVYMGVGFLIVGLPISTLFRSRPEEYGQLPDGEPPGEENKASQFEVDMSAKGALKTRAFWIIGIAAMFQMIAMLAVNIHMMPYLTSMGMERSEAAVAVTILSVITLTARVPFGILADMFTKKYVMSASIGLTALGTLIFGMMNGTSFAMLILFTVVYGIGTAGSMPLRAPIVREYFGVKRFGTIYGMMAMFSTIGTAAGAPIAGWVFDTYGDYTPIWYIYGAMAAFGMVMMLLMPRASANRENVGAAV